MKLLWTIAVGLLSSSVVDAGRVLPRKFYPKNGRGTRHPEFQHPANSAYRRRAEGSSTLGKRTCTECSPAHSDAISAPKENIWLGLTDKEAAEATSFLFSKLNLTVTGNATEWDNTVLLVELLHPNKSDALAYLDGSARLPERYAHAVLDFRATEEPYIQDYVVGPLPIVKGISTIQPLNYPYNKGVGKQRNINADEGSRSDFMSRIGRSIKDITLDLWGLQAQGLDNDTASIWGIDPLWHEDGRVVSWDQFWGNPTSPFDVQTLLPLGLYIKTDITGRDPREWKVLGIMYNDIFYKSIKAFRKAWRSPNFVKLGPNRDGRWSHTDHEGPDLPNDQTFPPAQVAPTGSRFEMDVEKKFVKWMDFSFYISFSRDTGISLWDIQYKGERIIYELGLQEALAHYAGNDPLQSGTSYLDSYYGFGPTTFQLIPGFDCPTYATYLNTSVYAAESTRTHVDSLCLFEQDSMYPISRHTTGNYAAATKNIFLTLRSISTVGNYDYMFDYQFFLDGAIGVQVRASGYIQSAYYANNEEYGFHIHDKLSGSMHDHVLNYKIDFDILGTKNSVATTEFIPTREKYSWSGGKYRDTMKLQKGWVESEDEGKIDWDANGSKGYVVVNKEEVNKFGEYRGYKLMPASQVIHSTVEKSSNLQEAAEWRHNHFYITKRKDTEPRSAHFANNVDTSQPVVNFNKFFDGESLDQEDIVMWFNLGMHHVPHTGDLPNTVFTTAHSGMMIEPFNYLNGSPVKQTRHMVRIDYNDAGHITKVERFGVRAPVCDVNMKSVDRDLSGSIGAVVVDKFPYDPRAFRSDSE